jgi:tRNA U34 5-methylaminomethyl-2-thiouridine-forming methyltransferase MnmC
MELIKTEDGSCTIRSEEYNENYNSDSGALEEALKKYVEPCCIRDGMNILDIGFGLGYNIGMAIHKAKNLKITSLEKDPFILRTVQTLIVPFWFNKSYGLVKKAALHLEYADDSYQINVLLGDARETIKRIIINDEKAKFDAVFLDPFSPPKNTELWTIEFFKEIRDRMKKGAILATYSCAGIVRRNLKAAGFEVKNGPSVGRRSPGTLAYNNLRI